MAKTNQIGVRFDTDKLEFIKNRVNLKTPQKVVNFLIDEFCKLYMVEKKSVFDVGVPVEKEIEVDRYEEPEKQKVLSYEYFFSLIAKLEEQEECLDFVMQVEASNLAYWQKDRLKKTLQSKWA